MTKATRSEGEPHDELTRIAGFGITAIEGHGVRGIVMVMSEDGRGGIAISGYDDDTEAMVDMFMHLHALFEANGKTLMVVPVGDG